MSCDREALSAFIDGELDPPARREMERHLESCAACAAERDAFVALEQGLASSFDVPGPSDRAVEAAVAAARLRVAGEPVGLWQSICRLFALRVSVPAPALALGLAAVLVVLLRGGAGAGRTGAELAGHDARPARPALAVLQEWPDSSELWMQGPEEAPDEQEKVEKETRAPGGLTHVVYEESIQI